MTLSQNWWLSIDLLLFDCLCSPAALSSQRMQRLWRNCLCISIKLSMPAPPSLLLWLYICVGMGVGCCFCMVPGGQPTNLGESWWDYFDHSVTMPRIFPKVFHRVKKTSKQTKPLQVVETSVHQGRPEHTELQTGRTVSEVMQKTHTTQCTKPDFLSAQRGSLNVFR